MDEYATGTSSSDSGIRPEAQAEALHSAMEQYCRALLDQPIPMLGNVSPREAASTAAGREKLVAWLGELAATAAGQRTVGSPLGTFDSEWIWAELGLEPPRT
jgi:hypothetical protein